MVVHRTCSCVSNMFDVLVEKSYQREKIIKLFFSLFDFIEIPCVFTTTVNNTPTSNGISNIYISHTGIPVLFEFSDCVYVSEFFKTLYM